MKKFVLPKELLKITPYKGGARSFVGRKHAIKLSSNEGALGTSPKAVRAFKKAARGDALSLYPESSAQELREALAVKHKISANQIICGCGSDDLLQLLTRLALYKGGEGIHTKYGFALYPTLIRANGGVPVVAVEKNFHARCDDLLKKVTAKTKIVLLANPNNPTGTYLSFDELNTLRAKLRSDILLVIDSAYAEYMTAHDYDAGVKLVKQSDNVVMTRTFSKIYGLASVRLGWAYMPPNIADAINRIRQPFNVPTPTLKAAVAALKDEAFIKKSQAHNKKWLGLMKQALAPLLATDAQANFLLLDFGSKSKAARAWRFLGENGFVLRQMEEYGLESYLRMSLGTARTNRKVIKLFHALEEKQP